MNARKVNLGGFTISWLWKILVLFIPLDWMRALWRAFGHGEPLDDFMYLYLVWNGLPAE